MTYLVNDYKFCRFGRSTEIQIIVRGSLLTKRLFSSSQVFVLFLVFFLLPHPVSWTNRVNECLLGNLGLQRTLRTLLENGCFFFFSLQIVTWLKRHQEKRAVLTPTACLHSLPLIVEQWEKLLNLQFYSVHNFPPKVTVILRLLRFMELAIGYFQSEF